MIYFKYIVEIIATFKQLGARSKRGGMAKMSWNYAGKLMKLYFTALTSSVFWKVRELLRITIPTVKQLTLMVILTKIHKLIKTHMLSIICYPLFVPCFDNAYETAAELEFVFTALASWPLAIHVYSRHKPKCTFL